MGQLISPATDVVHAEAANLQIISILLEFDSAFEFTLWSLQCFTPPPPLSHNTFLDLTLLYIKLTILFMWSYSQFRNFLI